MTNKTLLRKIYTLLRSFLAGKGLSKYKLMKDINFLIEKLLKGKPKEFIESEGIRFYMDARASLEPLHEASHEPETTKLLKSILGPKDIFVDIGANLGWFSLIASRICNKVFSIEPNLTAYSLLLKNIAYNSITNISTTQCAIGEKSGKAMLHIPGDILVGSTLKPITKKDIQNHFSTKDNFEVHRQEVSVKILGEIVKNPNVVKIDTEGFEYEVLLGMRPILERIKPKLIIEHPDDRCVKILNKYGYKEIVELDKLNKYFVSKHAK